MTFPSSDGDAAADLLERRWFAAFKAASSVRAECEALLDAMEVTERAWNEARSRLAELELMRDALGEELARLDRTAGSGLAAAAAEVMTAA